MKRSALVRALVSTDRLYGVATLILRSVDPSNGSKQQLPWGDAVQLNWQRIAP
jgi:hypothetical protein